MIGDDGEDIVLFYEEWKGMVVGRPSQGIHIGYYDDDWNMSRFVPYNGTVTLSNTKID